jgi:hypothetical protein
MTINAMSAEKPIAVFVAIFIFPPPSVRGSVLFESCVCLLKVYRILRRVSPAPQ